MNCFTLSAPLPPTSHSHPLSHPLKLPLSKPLINTLRLQSLFYLSNYPLSFRKPCTYYSLSLFNKPYKSTFLESRHSWLGIINSIDAFYEVLRAVEFLNKPPPLLISKKKFYNVKPRLPFLQCTYILDQS